METKTKVSFIEAPPICDADGPIRSSGKTNVVIEHTNTAKGQVTREFECIEHGCYYGRPNRGFRK